MRSNTYQSTSHRDHDRHHHNSNSYAKNPRYTSYASNRSYSSNRSTQHPHSHRSAHSAHNMHNSYSGNHSIRSSSNHNHSVRRHSTHSSLHSVNNSRNTHNPQSHSNHYRNNSHHNNSTSHRPHSNPRNNSRNIRHSVHSAHRSANRNTAHLNTKELRNKSPTQKISRSRNIRNINTSHSLSLQSIPVVDLVETPPKHNYSSDKKEDKAVLRSIQTVDILTNTMNQLSFVNAPYKYDHVSKINLSLEAAKHDVQALKFNLNPTKIREWNDYKTKIEKTNRVRDNMLLCLKLINKLMTIDEAIDFIFAPNSCKTNPEFYVAFEAFDKDKNGRNMCLEWVQNLLYSDAYETVDDFAADMRLIFDNICNVFEPQHEWSKNARFVQHIFEEELVCISRKIANANDVFTQNGNPSFDPQQVKCLNEEQNKEAIRNCVQLLQTQRKRDKEAAKYHDTNQVQDINEHKSNAKHIKSNDEVLTKKQERIKYLENIDRSKRKRASKQKLKSRKDVEKMEIECEEGEIQQIEALNECKLDETTVWFEFIAIYPAYAVDIKRVIMICEGFKDEIQFKIYKNKRASVGSDLSLNIKNKSAAIQCKIYDILQSTKNKITAKNPLLLSVLQDLTEKKSKQRNMKKRVRNSNKKVLDPYSNEAMQEKRKIQEMHAQEMKLKQMQSQQQQQQACKQKTEMEIDEDSEGSFDDNLYFDHDMMDITQTVNVYNNKIAKVNNNTIAKQLPSNGYRPIRPNNVDDVFDDEQIEYKSNSPPSMPTAKVMIQDEEDTSQWDKFKYTKQQQADDEEEIDF